ncbi:hypothetical protein [Nocardioides sp.]|uniref:hypothetical protein n=1 Tax=Nocardioides sp. TaxID=35761 RepID=UPI00271FF8B0|nr:hypothetical protein [Nocardioides sp.]MDO9456393.1 hypothetical protein [Nocardioides sp.]
MTHRPSPALIALVVVLLLAASGTSYAAGRAQAGDALVKKGSLSGNRLKPDTVTGRQVKESTLTKVPRSALADRVARVPRVPLPLDPAWAGAPNANNSPYYGVDALGWVHLEGAVTRVESAGSVIAALPVGARPTASLYLAVYTSAGGALTPGAIQIGPDGRIIYANGGNGLISLESITFRAAAG